MKKVLRTMIAIICAIGLLPALGVAQTAASGPIEGVVPDATGGVLPGAIVVVRNLGPDVRAGLDGPDGATGGA